MKLFIITLACICLVITLTGAQPIPLTPAPPSTEISLDTLNRAVEALETLSASSSNTVNAAVVLQSVFNLVIFGGGLIFVWRGGLKPLHSTMENDRKRAEKAELDEERTRLTAEAEKKAQDEIRLKMSEALQKTAEAQERMANNTETRTEAGERTKTAVTTINEHTDKALIPITEALEKVIQLLNAEEEARAKRHETLDLTIAEATRELMALKQAVQSLADTGELSPDKVPDTDPSKPDIWSDEDTPPERSPRGEDGKRTEE